MSIPDVTKSPTPRSDAAECIVIGGSAGAIDALITILPSLPKDFSLPVLIVVHLSPNERSLLPEIFAPRCQVPMKEAEDKEPIRAGTVYFAPPNYHLQVESDYTLSLSSDEPVFYSRPAIDILFETAADVYGTSLRAVLLSGASADGAAGVVAVHKAGGISWIQNPTTTDASIMPRSGLEACAAARSLDVPQIAREISALSQTRATTS